MKHPTLKMLQPKDTIAIIAPSDSFKNISLIGGVASERLQKELGVSIEYGDYCLEVPNLIGSASIKSRVSDLHHAFQDKRIKAILCATGGFNANDLLPHINWEIIKDNPKPFVGSSDITVLLNVIYAKTGMVTYHGPNFYKFGMKLGLEYILEYFQKAIFSSEPFFLSPSQQWSEDKWYKDQDNRVFHDNDGYIVCNPGVAKGNILGGNLCSFNLLQGTSYMPKLKDTILFLEEDNLAGELTFGEFYRNLQSLLQQPYAGTIKGLLIGRFLSGSQMTEEKLRFIVTSNDILSKIPVVANIDFGHTDPALTFPIGGTVELLAKKNKVEIKIVK